MHPSSTHFRWLPAALACACIAACAPIRITGQQICVRQDVAKDTLDVLLVYQGIHAGDGDECTLAEALRFSARVSNGRREFMILDWPLLFDLDELEGKRATDESSDPTERAWLDWMHGISVVKAGRCWDEKGRLALYQHLHAQHAARLIELSNDLLLDWIEERVSEKSLASDTRLFDDRTRDLWIEMAKKRTPWLKLADGRLAVDLSMTEGSAARVLAWILEECRRDTISAGQFQGLSASIASLRIADENLHLEFASARQALRFDFVKDADYTPLLQERIQNCKDFPVGSPGSADEVLPTSNEIVRDFTGG